MYWYCIHTKPKKELSVEKYLKFELGLETFFPRLRRRKVIRRVNREVVEPLFPRYLFCRFSVERSFRAVTYGPDVIEVVSTGSKPKIVDELTIHQLKAWAGKDDQTINIEAKSLKKGDPVKITAGPMQGLGAIFLEEQTQDERVSILLNLMNTDVQLKISRINIEIDEA